MFFKAVITVLMIIGGFAAMIWVANWPFNTPWEKTLDPEQRRINAEHNRRHHRGVARIVFPVFAIAFAVASVSLLNGSTADRSAAVVMGVCSALCAGVFTAIVRRGRRQRSSPRR
ncbi:hypothetical protein [Micromonospora auratinigra]|uniref:Uncharacterized protein n=1 Tax=Micromonospora auratinigra TaxID=261654 RepID=A0A1A8Z889_9ACTN|nr:hypothetical protein [Micromonospora auratinigra]SBT40165.1 hypothetical protein GA0070611_1159 [Micromonospora auratinigra]